MDAFEAFTHGEPNVKPQHRSLYYFLLGYARKRGHVPRFALPYEVGMHGSSIGSWVTYDAAIKALAGWGFIVYTPGANRYKVPVVELTFRNPSGDELLDYWQAYCLAHPVELQNRNPSPVIELQNFSSTDNSTANPSGDIKKRIREKENKSTTSAATPSLSSEKSRKSKPVASPKKAAAHLDEIAALPLPHAGPEFASLWASFSTGPKQIKKPLTAHQLMLTKLGKYPEAFAIVMLEAAIQGDWSGIENGGTAKAFTDWQAEIARRPPPRSTPSSQASVPSDSDPALNHEFLAEQQAREQAAFERQNADYRRRHGLAELVNVNPDALFGHTLTPAQGLARAKQGPDYQRYLDEEAAEKAKPAAAQQPDPPDSAQKAA